MRRSRVFVALAAVAAAPALLKAPEPVPAAEGRPATLWQVVDEARATTLGGWDLVDLVTRLVNERYTHYSAWHLWENPETSFRHGRGMSNQYNSALAQALTALGFDVSRVHAARVRMDRGPWWHSGHTWLQVSIDGRTRDVCAGRHSNTAGNVDFVPVTPVRPFTSLSYIDTTVALVPFVLEAIWRSLITRTATPRWLYRPFGEPVELDR